MERSLEEYARILEDLISSEFGWDYFLSYAKARGWTDEQIEAALEHNSQQNKAA